MSQRQGDEQDHTFAARYGPWAVVAGASEGIGACMAEQLAAKGLHLVLAARNEARLQEVAERLRQASGAQARVLALDLTDPDAVGRVVAATSDLDIGLVVHNAGAANRTAEFLDVPLGDWLALERLNCTTPMELAAAFLPTMRERGRGGFVIIGSLACLTGAARTAVYSAAKIFGVHLAEGLWAELHDDGVDVCAAVLGSVDTPAAARQGVAFDPDRDMRPDDVAREVLANIGNGPTYVVGDRNRAMAAALWTVDRRAAVELVSSATRDYQARTAGSEPSPGGTRP